MTKLKQTAFAFGTACALAFTGGLAALNTLPAVADTGAVNEEFYGAALNGDPIALEFYNGLVAMRGNPADANSTLRQGGEYDLPVSDDLNEAAAAYESGSTELVKQFGAAVDCFRYDYADLFWVDFDLLNFNVVKESTTTAPDPDPNPTEPENPDETETQAEEGDDGTGGDDNTQDPPVVPPTETASYKITIGAGRAKSYFLYDVTPEELNGTDNDGLYAKYATAYSALLDSIDVAEGATVKEKAAAVNSKLKSEFTYGYGFGTDGSVSGVDRFVNTTNAIVPLVAGDIKYASSEGLARLFKAIMNDLDVDCRLVSGYYVQSGTNTVQKCMWNYVRDGEWYAVDVANNIANDDKYLFASGETFLLEHFEAPVVSLSRYQIQYPDLHENEYSVESGELQIANGSYAERNGIAVKYAGSSENKLALRVKDGENWGEWTTFEELLQAGQPDAPETVDEGDGETDPTEPTEPVEPDPEEPVTPEPESNIVYDAENGIYYLFELTEGEFQIGVLSASGELIETGETVQDSFKDVVLVQSSTNDLRPNAQTISAEFTITIKYQNVLNKINENAEITADYTVSSPLGYSVNEAFVKEHSQVKSVTVSGNVVTITFVPSSLLEHNGLRYTFTVNNLQSTSGALPQSYPVVFKFDGIKAGGLFKGGNLYTDVVTQPSLVFNNEISLSGWTYNGSAKVTENMLSALALNVTKPAGTIDTAITQAVKNSVGEAAYAASENFILNLTLDGKSVSIPSGSYLKLAFPYLPENGPESDVVYKVLQFKKGEDGNPDYANPEVLDAVATRQGLVVAVNEFSAFALVAVNASGTQPEAVITQTSGVGGTVKASTNKPVNTIQNNAGAVTYTITAKEGYTLDYLAVNGVDKSADVTGGENGVYTFTLNYTALQGDDTNRFNVLRVEFKPEGAEEGAYAVANAASAAFVADQRELNEYTTTEWEEIIRDYPTGGVTAPEPPKPPVISTGSTQMQLIIVLSVVAAFAVIGSGVLVYCAAIRPKIIREREEEAARIAANRERRANRNRMGGSSYDPKNPRR